MKHLPLALALAAALVATTAAFAVPARTQMVHLVMITPLLHRPGHGELVANMGSTQSFDSALCTISIDRGSLHLRRRGLQPEHPSDNRLGWHWLIKPNTPLGRWQIRINCGSAGSLRTSFKVIR